MMVKQQVSEAEIQAMAEEIIHSRKYRNLAISDDTVIDLLRKELTQASNQKEALHAVRQKLHNIVAPYLGDPDYQQSTIVLHEAFQSGDADQVRNICAQIMTAHSSTRERLPILEAFYQSIFEVTGKPSKILDVACGLNPLSFPWMGLPTSTKYYAYDIHGPRVDFLNTYFKLQGLGSLAYQQDILVNPPQVDGKVAFIFKEVHRFEQRQKGRSALLLDALHVNFLVVSLPAISLNRRFNLIERQRQLINWITAERPWMVTEILFESELVFCIDKRNHGKET